jgi:hypothetical protein
MPLIPEAFQVNDLVELHDGRLAVLIHRETEGFKAKIVERWLDPLAPKPIATSEIEITPAHIKHLLEDERVSWVSPAYLHLTTNGPYASEYEVAANLQGELGNVTLCIIVDNDVSEVTTGIYMVANGRVVVTSRMKTQEPAATVLQHVVKNYSQNDIPGLPRFRGSADDNANVTRATNLVLQTLTRVQIRSNEFGGTSVDSRDESWWTTQLDEVFVAAAVVYLGEETFMDLCERRWKTEATWEDSESIPAGLSQQFGRVYKKIEKFLYEAVPDCLAWLGDDRWSENERWQESRRAITSPESANHPRWHLRSAVTLSADIAVGFEDYLLDESMIDEQSLASSALQEIYVWDPKDDGEATLSNTGMQLPTGVDQHLLAFLKFEFCSGILEVADASEFRWSGDGYEVLNGLRNSKPGLLVVEGAAGTGKTITMAHRAVDASGRVPKVLIVVPTHAFKRRLQFLLRRVQYRGSRMRRNNIEVTTPNLIGGPIRDDASKRAYSRSSLEWGKKKYQRQWNAVIEWYKDLADANTQPAINHSVNIVRSIAIEELKLHSRIREGDDKVPFQLNDIPAYGAIFIDEAQDLKGWDWMKLASFSLAFTEQGRGAMPELAVFVDRRQDIFGVIPNFDVVGPDDDPDRLNDDEFSAEREDVRTQRLIVRDPNGILQTPLFNITRLPGTAQTSLQYKRAPEKDLQKYSIGFRRIQELRKAFHVMTQNGVWPVELKSLSTTLRQSKDLARRAARIASAIERQHDLDDSSENDTPLPDLNSEMVFQSRKVSDSETLRKLIYGEIELTRSESRLMPLAIAVKSKEEVIALTLLTADAAERTQSESMIQSQIRPMVRARSGKPMGEDVVNIPLATKTLGVGTLTLVVPNNPPGGHRGLHRVGSDCVANGAMRLSNGSRRISIGTIAGLKGLEFGSLLGLLTDLDRVSLQQSYVLHSRPRYRLTIVEAAGDVLANTVEGNCAELIAGCLPPWGGAVFCHLDDLTKHIRNHWNELKEELERDRVKLHARWIKKAGQYGKTDKCFRDLGPPPPKAKFVRRKAREADDSHPV